MYKSKSEFETSVVRVTSSVSGKFSVLYVTSTISAEFSLQGYYVLYSTENVMNAELQSGHYKVDDSSEMYVPNLLSRMYRRPSEICGNLLYPIRD